MPEKMNMATKIILVELFCSADEQASCKNELGQWHEPFCDKALRAYESRMKAAK